MLDMIDVPFVFVDVFAAQPLEGNPVSVVPNADALDLTTMKRIAREFNQSETTFIVRPTTPEANWRLRSFTPAGHEVFGAGHNALGAWWWLAASGKLQPDQSDGKFHQEIGDRVLPVEIEYEGGRPASVAMVHETPRFGAYFDDIPRIARALGLESSDIAVENLRIQVVSTGAPHMLVPLKNREAIDRARPNSELLLPILASIS